MKFSMGCSRWTFIQSYTLMITYSFLYSFVPTTAPRYLLPLLVIFNFVSLSIILQFQIFLASPLATMFCFWNISNFRTKSIYSTKLVYFPTQLIQFAYAICFMLSAIATFNSGRDPSA